MAKSTKDYEGFKKRPYQDPSGKNRSVGYGINIDDPSNKGLIPDDVINNKRDLTPEEGEKSYGVKMGQAQSTSRKTFGKQYDSMPDEAKAVVDDMHYNMGGEMSKKFPGFTKAIQSGDYGRAADELQFSDADKKNKETPYYQQTKHRAQDHVAALKNLSSGMDMRRQYRAMKGIND